MRKAIAILLVVLFLATMTVTAGAVKPYTPIQLPNKPQSLPSSTSITATSAKIIPAYGYGYGLGYGDYGYGGWGVYGKS